MKALSVDGIEKTISEVDIEGVDDLEFLLGGGSVVSDDLDPEHQIFFDENCFIKQINGRFQIDALPPIAGKAVLVRVTDDAFSDITWRPEQLEPRVKFF
jgi:hypothetical protein